MKKILALGFLVAAMGMFLGGCSETDGGKNNPNNEIDTSGNNNNSKNVTITFDMQGGIPDIEPIIATSGVDVFWHFQGSFMGMGIPITMPTKENSAFSGFYLSDGTRVSSPINASENITVFAQWEDYTDISWYDSLQTEFTITTAEQLRGLSALSRLGMVSTSFIDKPITILIGNNIDLEGNKDNQWRPIEGFNGVFDGRNNVISGVYIDATRNNLGLFTTLWGGTVKNLELNVYITGQSSRVGGLVGYILRNVVIENVRVNGNIGGMNYVGGLVGTTVSNVSSISNSQSTANIAGNNFVGGLMGGANPGVVINNCFATGNVDGQDEVGGLVGRNDRASMVGSYATGNVSGRDAVGGLVGGAGGFTSSETRHNVDYRFARNDNNAFSSTNSIVNSRATGDVSGNNFVGGLIGETSHHTQIINSHSTGNVSGVDFVGGLLGCGEGGTGISNSYARGDVEGSRIIGGLTGEIRTSIGIGMRETVNNSFATGNVIGQNEVGGLIGRLGRPDITLITNSFYNSETTGQSDDDGRGTPLTTAEMKQQSTFVNWDFTEIWGISSAINDGYPHLRIFQQ